MADGAEKDRLAHSINANKFPTANRCMSEMGYNAKHLVGGIVGLQAALYPASAVS